MTQEGSVQFEVALPSRLSGALNRRGADVSPVVIGVDPHKHPGTTEIIDDP